MTLAAHEIEMLVQGEHDDAFRILGQHAVQVKDGTAVVIRAFLPEARAVRVLPRDSCLGTRTMVRIHEAGLFEAVFADQHALFAYRLEVDDGHGTGRQEDPYRFPSTLSDYDRHLLAEGTHYGASDKLGAHPTVLEGVE